MSTESTTIAKPAIPEALQLPRWFLLRSVARVRRLAAPLAFLAGFAAVFFLLHLGGSGSADNLPTQAAYPNPTPNAQLLPATPEPAPVTLTYPNPQHQ